MNINYANDTFAFFFFFFFFKLFHREALFLDKTTPVFRKKNLSRMSVTLLSTLHIFVSSPDWLMRAMPSLHSDASENTDVGT